MGMRKSHKQKRGLGGAVGGDGQSIKTAIIINATSMLVGVPAEYEHIEKRHGQQDADWSLET